MKQPQKWFLKGGSVALAGSALLLACSACCLPLAAPVLAWLGVAGLALMGPVGLAAAAIGGVAIVWATLARRRRRLQRQTVAAAEGSCTCRGTCGSGISLPTVAS